MLERLTVADFTPLLGTEFRLPQADGSSQAVRLQSASVVGTRREEGVRDPFALHFIGSGTDVLPQAIYRLESDAMPAIDIFLVPIARDQGGTTYEAIFT